MTYEEAKYRAMLRDLRMTQEELERIIKKCRANGYRLIVRDKEQSE